jgi:transcriptional regulator with GAF, ATPase, and Fis domain
MNYIIENLNAPEEPQTEIKTYLYIGKDPSCGMFIENNMIEKKHCLIEVKNNAVFIKDLRSTLGTYINGTRIIEAELQDGDIITVGSTELMLHNKLKVKKEFSLSSESEHWNKQLSQLSTVAQTQFPVLLLGPSGTGKDVIAQRLHQQSQRAQHIFLSVNCSALSETLIESELFGHTKGSFTGAVADRKGAFETARGGTLFLDEIGDLPYTLQSKLLRALENSEIRPVGCDRNIKTNVRIIAATHQNLYQKIREGSFRSDLFYRLNVVSVEVPPLKERMEDFETLLYIFAKEMRVRFSHNAILKLKSYDWPGNIRELKNVVSRASALFPKKQIDESHIQHLLNRKEKLAHAPTGVNYSSAGEQNQLSVIREIERQMILKRLAANHGNQKRTAIDLGMPKSTLHDRIRTYSIKVGDFKI